MKCMDSKFEMWGLIAVWTEIGGWNETRCGVGSVELGSIKYSKVMGEVVVVLEIALKEMTMYICVFMGETTQEKDLCKI